MIFSGVIGFKKMNSRFKHNLPTLGLRFLRVFSKFFYLINVNFKMRFKKTA